VIPAYAPAFEAGGDAEYCAPRLLPNDRYAETGEPIATGIAAVSRRSRSCRLRRFQLIIAGQGTVGLDLGSEAVGSPRPAGPRGQRGGLIAVMRDSD